MLDVILDSQRHASAWDGACIQVALSLF